MNETILDSASVQMLKWQVRLNAMLKYKKARRSQSFDFLPARNKSVITNVISATSSLSPILASSTFIPQYAFPGYQMYQGGLRFMG
jgi:hypothetical protein